MGTKKPILRRGIQVNPPPGQQQSLAAGYWGPGGPKARMVQDQVVERIIRSNRDLLGMGVVADIWVAPSENKSSLPVCGCVKATNQSADVRCAKCHGLKYIPGYVKWGYNTCFFAAVALGLTGQTDAGYSIPTTIVKNTTSSLHTLGLAAGVLSAAFETHDFAVDTAYSSEWDMQALVYNRGPGNSYTVEWSLDRGATWLSGDFTKLVLSRGTIRFRVTLSRVNANSPSPQFEVLRFRHPVQDEPWIKVAPPLGIKKRKRDSTGETDEQPGTRLWTVPLEGKAMVNGQVVYSKVWLPENPNFFFERKEGSFAGERYLPVSIERSEHIGVLTSQAFPCRKITDNEVMAVLW